MENKEEIKKEIGKRLKAALKSRRVTVTDVANELNVSSRAVSSWFSGEKDPGFSKIALLAEKYGVNPLYLITGEGPPLLPKEDKDKLSVRIEDIRKKKRRKKTKPYKGSIILS